MRKLFVLLAVFTLSCTGPVTQSPTGRTQVIFFPDSQLNQIAKTAFEETKETERLITSGERYNVVQNIGRNIAAVANKPEYEWEFILIDADTVVNAWAMPGGKVAIYTGIFPVAENSGGLAAVMAHEIGHALARHSNERASQGMLADLLATGASKVFEGSRNKNIWMSVFGATTTIGFLLPYSRTQESEADEIGIMLQARAGYDPAEAPRLWDRMAAMETSRPPQFLSTHPNPGARAAALRALLPAAQAEYDRTPIKQLSVPLPRR